jgi:Fe-S-cluster containining protein
MPHGKPAGVRCIQLGPDNLCQIFGHPQRPLVCASFQAEPGICGNDAADAVRILAWLEGETSVQGATNSIS